MMNVLFKALLFFASLGSVQVPLVQSAVVFLFTLARFYASQHVYSWRDQGQNPESLDFKRVAQLNMRTRS